MAGVICCWALVLVGGLAKPGAWPGLIAGLGGGGFRVPWGNGLTPGGCLTALGAPSPVWANLIFFTGVGGGKGLPVARAGGVMFLMWLFWVSTVVGAETFLILVMLTVLLLMVWLITVWLMLVTLEMYVGDGPRL
jgi:hypothetical protein